ncbi:MAG: FAD-dependent oxidoreductase [Lachnospiraceae bacterium]|nr:FAD-dependent oxidoreductase [Candidatus Minthocola equi]
MSVTYTQELPVLYDADVLVIGAGPAGIGAAISAARNGANTVVFDIHGCVGGMATIGMIGPFMTSYDASCKNMIIRGIFEELENKMIAVGKAIDPAVVRNEGRYASFFHIGHNNVGPFDRQYLKLFATRLIIESGAKLLLHTQFIDVLKEGNKITGVVVANKDGMGVIKAKQFVDCTGDADVAAKAGVNYELGDSITGNMQPMSMFLRVSHVDSQQVEKEMREHSAEIRPFFGPYSWLIKEKAEDWGDFPRGEVCVFGDVEEDEFRLNVTRILNADGTKTEDLTRAEIEGLEQAHRVFNFMKKNAKGFENARLAEIADTIGIRETRHIEGEYRLSGDEVANCVVQPDAIACMATNMDNHNLNDPGGSLMPPTKGEYFGVPYLCLVAKGVDNLLVAGRAISADPIAASATRMMPCCMAFGQAAGTAAAIAFKNNQKPKDVDVQALRQTLRDQGAFVG